MSLSQKEFGNLRSLYESVYAPKVETILEGFTDEDLEFNFTDEYIEEQVEELFIECIEEGYDIDDIETAICEAVDAELEILTERVDPKETQRRRDQAKDRLATGAAMKSAAAKSSAPAEKKASALSRVKSAAKKVGSAMRGGVGLAARAVGTAQRAGSAVKSAAKKGYERGKQGSGGGSSSTSSASGSSSSTSSASGGSSSSSGSSGTSSASGGGSSAAPVKRKDGLLKRGLKKVVRGISKGVSAAAGAVKAGADSITDRARKEEFDMVDEGLTGARAQRARQMQDSEVKKGGGKRTLADRDTAFRLGTGTGPGRVSDRPIKSQSDQGKGNAAKRRMKMEELEATGLFSEKEIEAIMEAEMREGYDEPKMHSAVKRVMTTQPAAKGRAASRLHSKYSMRSKGNVAGETDGPGPNAPKRSGRKGRGSETDRGSGNAAKRRMEG